MKKLIENKYNFTLKSNGKLIARLLFILLLVCAFYVQQTQSVQAAPPPIPIKTITTVDSQDFAGWYTSIALNSSDLPVISYAASDNLTLAVCNDLPCSNPTIITVVSEGIVGRHTSIALDSNDFPVISYHDYSNRNLKLAVCNDRLCSNPTLTTVDSGDYVGEYTSMALNSSGLPVISYSDYNNRDLKLAVCNDPFCSNPTLTTVDGDGDVGEYTSLTLNNNHLPIISYYDATNSALKMAACNDYICSNPTLTTIDGVDEQGAVGTFTSIALNANGLPVISYFDITNADLKVAFCNDAACTVRTITTVDSEGHVGSKSSMTLNSSGFPVISYYDATNNNLNVAVCNSPTCDNPTLITVDSQNNPGWDTSITLNNSGVPIISYRSHGIHHLKVAVCNICAISPQRTTVDDGNGDWVGLHTSLALNNYDVPAISHYNDTDDDLLFTLCYNEPCQGSTTQTVDATGDVGKYNSLALKSNSEPVISYFDDTANDLMIAVCANLGCSAHTLNIVSGILNVDTGKYSSLALNSSDKPIISFYSDLITGLILANCDDTLCSPPAPVTTVDNSANVGWQTSIVLNKDEHAVISYYDVTNFDLKLAICNDAACSNPTIRIVDNGDGVGATSSIALNSNGFPVISYYDSNNTALKVAVCPNATCTTPTLTTVDNTGFVGLYTSIALNSNDHPIISYRDTNNSALKVAFCTDIACTNPALMTVDGAGDLAAGEYSSLALDSSGYPVVSYYDHTNYNLKLAQFDYLPAPTDVSIHLNDSFEANLAWSGGSLYDVRYATVPYIYCGEPSIVGNDIPSPFDVSSFIGDPASNHFFVVSRRHVPCPNSNWVGEFDFALVAGE